MKPEYILDDPLLVAAMAHVAVATPVCLLYYPVNYQTTKRAPWAMYKGVANPQLEAVLREILPYLVVGSVHTGYRKVLFSNEHISLIERETLLYFETDQSGNWHRKKDNWGIVYRNHVELAVLEEHNMERLIVREKEPDYACQE